MDYPLRSQRQNYKKRSIPLSSQNLNQYKGLRDKLHEDTDEAKD